MVFRAIKTKKNIIFDKKKLLLYVNFEGIKLFINGGKM